MPYFRKISPFRSRSARQSGQAIIEYVLILIITVSLVLALMNQVFKPFGTFIENYMGKYVGCLLEYGELPSLGSQDESPVDEDSECEKRFEAASVGAGRPPRQGGGNTNNPNRENNRERSSSERGGGGGTYAGSASRSRGIGQRGPQSGVESAPARPAGKTVEIALSSGPGGAYFNASEGGSSTTIRVAENRRYVAVTGLSDEEKKRLEREVEGQDKLLVTGEGIAQKPKKLAIKRPEAPMKIEPDEPFTLGDFMRILFIAAIIIALVIFVGGQVLQMSKSDNS